MISRRFIKDVLLEPCDNLTFSHDGKTHSVMIKKSSLADTGLYTVKATNIVGEVNSSAFLTVNGTYLKTQTALAKRYVDVFFPFLLKLL